jgi:hypothetical protein
MAEKIKLVIFHLTGAAGIKTMDSGFRVGMGGGGEKRANPGI